MLTFPPDDLAVLRAELARPEYEGLSDDQCADMLSRVPAAPNPDPAPTVPRPFDAVAVEALLSPASLGRFFTLPLGPRIVDCLNSGDRMHSAIYAQALASVAIPGSAETIITAAERDRILARLAEAAPDPSWPAEVAGTRRVDELFGPGKTWSYERPDPFAPPDDPDRTIVVAVDYIPASVIAEARS